MDPVNQQQNIPSLEPKKNWFARHSSLTDLILFLSATALVLSPIAVFNYFKIRSIFNSSEKQFKEAENTQNISTWKTYTDTEFGYEIKYPSSWFQSIHGPNLVLTMEDQSNGYAPSISITVNDKQPVIEDNINNDISRKIISTFKFTNLSNTINTPTWETYTNTKYGFEFKYPPTWSVVPPGIEPYVIAYVWKKNPENEPIENDYLTLSVLDTSKPDWAATIDKIFSPVNFQYGNFRGARNLSEDKVLSIETINFYNNNGKVFFTWIATYKLENRSEYLSTNQLQPILDTFKFTR